MPNVPILLATCLAAQVPPPAAAVDPAGPILAARHAALDRERAGLTALAGRLDGQGDGQAAGAVRALIEPEGPPGGPIRFRPLPEVVPNLKDRPALPNDAATLRSATAKALRDLAARAARQEVDRLALADELLRAALERTPDDPELRRLLGQVPHLGGWATPHARAMLQKGLALHPTFGWVPADWTAHLERGELPGPVDPGGRVRAWLPAAEADALRRDMSRPWTIDTAHFRIRTTAPFSESIAFGRRLEDLHELFFALMADVIGRANLPLARRLASPTLQPEATSKRMEVYYFASQAEYVAYLRPLVGRGAEIEKELGRYQPPRKGRGGRPEPGRSFFFRDPGGQLDATATLYHEASHQILFESAGTNRIEDNRGNYWVFEGLGTYFETLAPQPDGTLIIGTPTSPRLDLARHRILDVGEILPLADLVALDRARFDDGDVYFTYAESMALAVFLMHGRAGRYRDGFLDYAADAYRGHLRGGPNGSLAGRLGVPYATLQAEFVEFLRADARVGSASPAGSRRK